MEKIKRYQKIIINLLEQQVAPYQKAAKGEVEEQLIFDTNHAGFSDRGNVQARMVRRFLGHPPSSP